MTLKTILTAAALLAATPAFAVAADYRLIDENDEGRGVLELPISTNADGDKQATMFLMFAPIDDDSRATPIVRMTLTIDCDGNRYHLTDPTTFTADMTLTGSARHSSGWTPIPPESRLVLTHAAACKGEALPVAGDDMKTIARDYYATKRH